MNPAFDADELDVGDVVYVWNLEIGRPEQELWVGTIIDFSDEDPDDAEVLWSHGVITTIKGWRLAPLALREKLFWNKKAKKVV